MVDLSVIIVSWNVRDLLGKCLYSLQQSRRSLGSSDDDAFEVEVIVVDSASDDGSVELVREGCPEVICRLNPATLASRAATISG